MGGPEFVITIIAIGCATSLLKALIDRKNDSSIDEESFNRLARAFMQHKKEMQERVQNLETIIADDEKQDSFAHIEEPRTEGTFTNDLKNKDSVRS